MHLGVESAAVPGSRQRDRDRSSPDDVEDRLAAATMKVSKAHLLLLGIVDQADNPAVKGIAIRNLALLEDAVAELREVALSLKALGWSPDALQRSPTGLQRLRLEGHRRR